MTEPEETMRPHEPEPVEPLIDVRLRPEVLALVALGGALGALARYGTTA